MHNPERLSSAVDNHTGLAVITGFTAQPLLINTLVNIRTSHGMAIVVVSSTSSRILDTYFDDCNGKNVLVIEVIDIKSSSNFDYSTDIRNAGRLSKPV